MDTLCKTCQNRCKVTSYHLKRKVGEICFIRFDGGGDCDPVNLLSEGCKFYELDIKTMRKKRNNMSYKPTSE